MNMTEFWQNLNGIYVLIMCAGIVGAFFAGRRGRQKEITDAANQLNETLVKEVAALRRRVTDLEQDRNKQYDVLDTVRYALRQEGLSIVINGEFVSLLKAGAPNKITRIKSRRPVPPATQQDDDDDDAV